MTSLDTEFQSEQGRTPTDQDPDSFAAPNLSQDEFAEHLAARVAAMLEDTKFVEIVELRASVAQIHIMFRVKKSKEKTFAQQVVDPLLRVMYSVCSGHIGKQFILLPPDPEMGEMRFAWVISYASTDLRAATAAVCGAISSVVPKPTLDVMEAPMLGHGAPSSGGLGTGRKGAIPLKA